MAEYIARGALVGANLLVLSIAVFNILLLLNWDEVSAGAVVLSLWLLGFAYFRP